MIDALTAWTQQGTGLEPWMVGLVAVCVVLAAFVRGMTGFGMAIISAPLLGLLMDPARAVMLNLLLGALIGPMGYGAARRLADSRQTVPFTLAFVAAAPAGLWVLAQVPAAWARPAIAAIALLSFFVVTARRPAQPPPGTTPAVGYGAAAGFIGAFAGIPGPAAVYYFVRDGVPPATSRASLIVVFFWAVAATAVLAVLAGQIDLRLAVLAMLMLPALVAGNVLGERCFGKVNPAIWRGAILMLLAVAALAAIWRSVSGGA